MIRQYLKFGIVGGVNTAIDFLILNILMFFTGITAGYGYIMFKSISFIAANINSYFLNKKWTFKSDSAANRREMVLFFTVSIIGLLINAGTASFIVTFIDPINGISPTAWANVGALVATAVSLVWNFFGYKIIVFS